MNCEKCDYADIYDWEQDAKTGKAKPLYWCERHSQFCEDMKECSYKESEEE